MGYDDFPLILMRVRIVHDSRRLKIIFQFAAETRIAKVKPSATADGSDPYIQF